MGKKYISVFFAVFILLTLSLSLDAVYASESDTLKSMVNRIIVYDKSNMRDSAESLIEVLLKKYPLSVVSAYSPEEIGNIQREFKLIENSINDLHGSFYYDSLKNYTSSVVKMSELEPKPESLTDNKEIQHVQQPVTKASTESDRLWYFIFGILIITLIIFSIYLYRKLLAQHDELKSFKRLMLHKEGNSLASTETGFPAGSAKFEKTEKDINALQENLQRFADKVSKKFQSTDSKINELFVNVKAVKELQSGFIKKKEENRNAVTEQVNEYNENKKNKDHDIIRVEYFHDVGKDNFRKTSSSTPFYIKKFPGRSELYVDENNEISPYYTEQIRNCFNVSGSGKRIYKVVRPAECNFDDSAKTWILKSKGVLES